MMKYRIALVIVAVVFSGVGLAILVVPTEAMAEGAEYTVNRWVDGMGLISGSLILAWISMQSERSRKTEDKDINVSPDQQ